jgi:hypothetical protein
VTLLDKIRNSGHGIAGPRAGRTAALETYFFGITEPFMAGRRLKQYTIGEFMRRVLQREITVLRHLAVPALVLLLATGSAFAQSGNQDQGKPAANNPADAAKENQRKTDQFVEAAQAINGPAGNPECVWLGRRVVQLIWVDDLDTAFRHVDLYDRFGCPGGHIQAAFRCLTRFGAQIDDKVPNSLRDHVHMCWINPAAQPPQPSPTPTPAAAAGSATPAAVPAGSSPTPAPAATATPQPAASPSPASK